jgi:cytochrome c553
MMLTRCLLFPFILAFAALAATGVGAYADDIAQKAAVCTACHGEQGVPTAPEIPIIWGQNEGYIYLQLRDFKLGNRKNPLMSPVAQSLEKEDMLALAAYFSAKKWPALDQPSAPADVARHAEVVANSAGCQGCHLARWQGDGTTPRVGGQSIGYLRATMAAFRDGTRTNNPWMAALLKTYSDADIDALARYLAGQ